jgi:hypothetical protein
MGSLVTRLGFLVKAFHFSMKALFSVLSTDWK